MLSALRDMAVLVRDVRRKRFDLVVDFHSFRETNLLTWLSGAPRRIGMKRHGAPYLGFCFNRPPVLEDKSLHVAEMFERVVGGLSPAGAAVLPFLDGKPLIVTDAEKPRERQIALYVDAPVPERIWPAERFAEVADFAIENLNSAVVVISSKDRAQLAARVQKASRHRERLTVYTDLTDRKSVV